MKYVFLAMTLLLLFSGLTADAQWRSKTHDEYHALQRPADITIDGELDDAEGWEGAIESVTGTDGKPFCGLEFENIDKFQAHGGGDWKDNGKDHETCFAIVWDKDAIYLGISVTDDEHNQTEANAAGAWKGDGTQLAFVPSGIRQAGQQHILINVALNNDGILLLHNETLQGNPGLTNEQVAIVRNEDEKETYYELQIKPDNLGMDTFEEGYEFGLGICVIDGDLAAGQGGQKGWSGWYPHSIVFGKNSEQTGLVILTDEQLAVEAKNKLTTTWGRLKSTR